MYNHVVHKYTQVMYYMQDNIFGRGYIFLN